MEDIARHSDAAEVMDIALECAAAERIMLNRYERKLYLNIFKSIVGKHRRTREIFIDLTKRMHPDNHRVLIVAKNIEELEDSIFSTCDHVVKNVKMYLTALDYKNAGIEDDIASSDYEKYGLNKPDVDLIELRCFFLRVIGDFYRYKCEIIGTDDDMNGAEEAYKAAWEEADPYLYPMCPVRLGIAVNYSIFLFEMLGEKVFGYKLAHKAYQEYLDADDVVYEDDMALESGFTSIILRDNLIYWKEGFKAIAANQLAFENELMNG
ncbi:14-3-3 domain [Trinorchestia longiramus]|nr:14-3-3 domain [Trinorchestia longiramus]